MVLNGLINTRLLALCREFGIAAIGVSGVDGGLVKAHKRAPVTLASGEVVDYGMVGDIDGVDGIGDHAPARRRLPAGGEPAVLRRVRATCSTSTPTPWPRRSAARWTPRS